MNCGVTNTHPVDLIFSGLHVSMAVAGEAIMCKVG